MCHYKIKVTAENDGISCSSSFSPSVSAKKALPAPDTASFSLDIYNKAAINWAAVEDADGYYIRRWCGTAYRDIDAENVLSYTDSLEGIAPGTSIYYIIYPYCVVNGKKITENYKGTTSDYVRYSPVTGLKWTEDSSHRIVLSWDSFSAKVNAQNILYTVYVSDSPDGVFKSVTVTPKTTYTLDSNLYSIDDCCYVKVIASGYNSMYQLITFTSGQNPPLAAGNNITSPELENIGDLSLMRNDSGLCLTASVKNMTSSGTYSYRWYHTEAPGKDGTAIDGAEGTAYYPPTGSNGTRYYYCIVTVSGKTTKKSSVSNTAKVTVRTDISKITVGNIGNQSYTGKAVTPVPSVTDSGFTLKNGTDYTLTYTDNIQAGTATVTVTGKGNYTGSIKRTFKITAPVDAKPDAGTLTVPTRLTSSKYAVNQSENIISNVAFGTSADTFISGINEKKYCVLKKGNVNVSGNTSVGTGMKLQLTDGNNVKKSYTIIVSGDTNGDGKVNITDMISVKQHILGKSTLNGIYKTAGDVNGDGKINITDFIKIKAGILGKR